MLTGDHNKVSTRQSTSSSDTGMSKIVSVLKQADKESHASSFVGDVGGFKLNGHSDFCRVRQCSDSNADVTATALYLVDVYNKTLEHWIYVWIIN